MIKIKPNAVQAKSVLTGELTDIAAIEGKSIDVRVNGASIVDENGVAEIPIAGRGEAGNLGVLKIGDGVVISDTGRLSVNLVGPSSLANRTPQYIVDASHLNASVTATLTDSNRLQLTDAQKEIALDTLGAASKKEIEELELFKFPNATIIGTPTIQNGQVSGFSVTDYLQFPFVLDLRGKTFEINFCFTTAGDISTQQNIIDSNFGIALAILNGKGVMSMSSNGTSWDIGSATGIIQIAANTTYFAKLSWNGSVYKTALSTDGNAYVDDMTINSTAAPHPRTILIGGGNLFGGHPFKGTIDLNRANLIVDGMEVWRGMDQAGIASRANVSLSNLDEDGLEVIQNEAKKNLTDYVKNTDYASSTIGGVFKPNSAYGTTVTSSGYLAGYTRTADYYKGADRGLLVNKGTLDNIIGDVIPDITLGTSETVTFLEEGDIPHIIEQIPYGTPSVAGLVKPAGAAYGLSYQTGGIIAPASATESDIDARTNNYKPIVPKNLDYAVESVNKKPWELIADVTNTEPITTMSVESNGTINLNSYKKFRIELLMKKRVEGGGLVTIDVNGSSYGYMSAGIHASGDRVHAYEFENRNGRFYMTGYAGAETNRDYLVGSATQIRMRSYGYDNEKTNITKIGITARVEIPVGSYLKLYGVLA